MKMSIPYLPYRRVSSVGANSLTRMRTQPHSVSGSSSSSSHPQYIYCVLYTNQSDHNVYSASPLLAVGLCNWDK